VAADEEQGGNDDSGFTIAGSISGVSGSTSRSDGLSFETWRIRFLSDAETHGLLHTAEQLGDAALRLFWEQGVAPTVRDMLASTDNDPLFPA